ncbi:MAG: deoxynucleoside kinase [Anaerolineae bacterium]
MPGRHISICGNVGVGKSTLARLIAGQTKCQLFLEEPEYFPFVENALARPRDWSFINQVDFLLHKFAQQVTIYGTSSPCIQEQDAYVNYLLWNPVLFNLGYISQQEHDLVDQIFTLCNKLVEYSRPQLHIVLTAKPETLLRRIHGRGREYETSSKELENLIYQLHEQVSILISTIQMPHLIVDCEDLDLTYASQARDELVNKITSAMSA